MPRRKKSAEQKSRLRREKDRKTSYKQEGRKEVDEDIKTKHSHEHSHEQKGKNVDLKERPEKEKKTFTISEHKEKEEIEKEKTTKHSHEQKIKKRGTKHDDLKKSNACRIVAGFDQFAFINKEIEIQKKWKKQSTNEEKLSKNAYMRTKDKKGLKRKAALEESDSKQVQNNSPKIAKTGSMSEKRVTTFEGKRGVKRNWSFINNNQDRNSNHKDSDELDVTRAKKTKLRDKIRKAAWRAKQSEERKESLKTMDRKRKLDQRQNQTDEINLQHRQQNKTRKQFVRTNLDETKKLHHRRINKTRKHDVRENMDEQAKSVHRKMDKTRKLDERENMDETKKLHHRRINKTRKHDVRENMDEQAKSVHRKMDKTRKLDERENMDETKKLHHRRINKTRKHDVRENMDEQAKSVHRKMDKTRKLDERENMDETKKLHHRTINKTRKHDVSENMDEQAKLVHRKMDKTRKSDKRENMDEQAKLVHRKMDKTRKLDERENMDETKKLHHRTINKTRKHDVSENMDEQAKLVHRKMDKTRKSDKRENMDEQAKLVHRKMDKTRKLDERENMEETKKLHHRRINKTRKHDVRENMDEQAKSVHRKMDKTRKLDKRENMDEQAKLVHRKMDKTRKLDERENMDDNDLKKRRLLDKRHKSIKRASKTADTDAAIHTFQQSIKTGPTFICTVCHRLMYKECVTIFEGDNFKACDQDLLEKCNTGKTNFDGECFICNTCSWNLKRNNLPAQAVANCLELDPIPDQLKDLSNLECTFISTRLTFMKILALPRGKQKAIHGCVVNVPVNPEETCSVLPHLPSSSSCITVKLKRKIEYRGHVIKQSVRPWKVLQALYYLKSIEKNPHYDDIVINENWQDESSNDNGELWDALTSNVPSNSQAVQVLPSSTENRDECDDDNPEDNDTDNDELEDRSELTGLPYDTCLQPKDMSADKDFLLNIAPGEGKKPTGMFADKHNEEMAFPAFFPTGSFGFDRQRERKISMKKYFSQRILNCDTRFATSTEYLFYAQYRCEAKQVADCLSIALRKCTGEHRQRKLTAGQIKDQEEMRKLARTDLSYHFLQNVRGSPAYFNKMLYELLGMIRQLGSCTWFLTLSAADMNWKDTIQVIAAQNGVKLTDEQVVNLTWEQKSTWLRSNPVTAARHFDHRLQLLMSTLVLGKSNPIGDVQDYKYRIEFQQRGSPHAHMLLWVKHAPSLSQNSTEEVSMFIDKYISCSLPDDNDLATLVKTVQCHRHSATCRKHGTKCRFSFPRPPLQETSVFLPPNEETNKSNQTIYSAILTSVHEKLDELPHDSDITLQSLLEELQIPQQLYVKALQWIKTKHGQPAVLLKRNITECFINNYNPILMKAWQANLDLQYVTNVYACIMYVASYVSKPEKTVGDVLKSVCKNSAPQGPKKMMETVSKKFLSHREVSAQEAVYRLLSLPLAKGSRQIIFVPTDLPENRTKLLKPMKIIQELDDDDDNLYLEGIIEKYELRPNSIENICLADFAANYTYSKKKENETEPNHLDEDINLQVSEHETDNLPKIIKIKTKSTLMTLRSRPVIIRSHQFSILKQPEQYYHAKLMLYLPWRNETRDLKGSDGLYKTQYFKCKPKFAEKMDAYEPNIDEYSQAVQELEDNGPPEDGWANLAPQTEQQQNEDVAEGSRDDPDFEAITPAADIETADLGLIPHNYELDSRKITNQQWLDMTLSLNKEQGDIHKFIVQWCTKMSMTYKTTKRPKPFHIFVSGGAGTGKSHLVRTIVQTANRILSIGQNAEDIVVIVCAFTGVAAFNIEGHTLHSAFNLPVNQSKRDDYIRLSSEKLSSMRSKLGNLSLLIIDEISMVGADHLYTIHRRLSEIMTSDDPFGGISVIAVGDLSQLPPVAQKQVFESMSDPIAALYGSIWQKHFQLIELHEIMRQKDDKQFAETLNRIRTSNHTDDDVQLIKSREIQNTSTLYPSTALHIFAFNKDVDNHNMEMIQNLKEPVITITAIDSKTDEQTGRIKNISFDEKKKPGGMLQKLQLAVGARVMMTTNVDTSDGLVNSASGTVTGFIPLPPDSTNENFSTYRPKYVLVQFDENRVGEKIRSKLRTLVPDGKSTPIAVHEVTVKLRKVSSKRTQFPLTLAWAVTIHKAQGRTVDQLVVSTKGSFKAGQMYTALSRVKTQDGLFILGEFTSSKISCNPKTVTEMTRMKKNNTFILNIPLSVTAPPDSFFKLSLLNINSLRPHFQCLSADQSIKTSDVIVLTETWLKQHITSFNLELSQEYHLYRQDYSLPNKRPQGGVAVYVRKSFRLDKELRLPDVHLQYQCLLLSCRMDPSKRLLIVAIYIPPNTKNESYFKNMENLLCAIPSDSVPTILCGDFNANIESTELKTTTLKELTAYYGFLQYIQQPTHRKGATLDHVYVNRNFDNSEITSVTPVHFSDHFHIHLAVPWMKLLYN